MITDMRRIFILILTNIKLNIFLAKSSQMTGKSVPVILATFLIWSYETNLLDNIYLRLVWLQVCSLRGRDQMSGKVKWIIKSVSLHVVVSGQVALLRTCNPHLGTEHLELGGLCILLLTPQFIISSIIHYIVLSWSVSGVMSRTD